MITELYLEEAREVDRESKLNKAREKYGTGKS